MKEAYMHKISNYRIITAAVMAFVFALTLFTVSCSKKNGVAGNYQTTKVTRGDLMVTVSSTGTLAPDDTVQVGTEVSGTIKEIYADYNDNVKKGQILARLKTDLLEAALHEAEASVSKCKAEDEEATINYKQNKALFDKGYLSEKEFLPYKTALATATSELISAQAALDKAKTNIDYATIYSPIDGVVLARNIQAGQTVAASYSTPTLFVLAKDLTNLKIMALVDETDISQIKLNQEVTFTVSAYPDKIFTGKVLQIRPQSTTVSNVVNYTVIVSANNDEHLLLPGMTTTIEFIVNKAENALLVPNTALKFHPQIQKGKGMRPHTPPPHGQNASGNTERHDSFDGTPPPNMPTGGPDEGFASMGGNSSQESGNSGTKKTASSSSSQLGMVWILDSTGQIKPARVKIVLANESTTAISSEDLKENDIIVIGSLTNKKSSRTASSTQKSGGRPGMFF
jgi:HlyD family secretion protein